MDGLRARIKMVKRCAQKTFRFSYTSILKYLPRRVRKLWGRGGIGLLWDISSSFLPRESDRGDHLGVARPGLFLHSFVMTERKRIMLQRSCRGSCVLPLSPMKVRICKFEFEKRPKDLMSRHPAKAFSWACSRICCSHSRLKQISLFILTRNSARFFIIHYTRRNKAWICWVTLVVHVSLCISCMTLTSETESEMRPHSFKQHTTRSVA